MVLFEWRYRRCAPRPLEVRWQVRSPVPRAPQCAPLVLWSNKRRIVANVQFVDDSGGCTMNDDSTPTALQPGEPTGNEATEGGGIPAGPSPVPSAEVAPTEPTERDGAAAVETSASVPSGGASIAPGGPVLPPTRRRPPMWAWASGGLVLLLAIVLVAVVVVRVNEPGTGSAATDSSPPSAAPAASALPSSTPRATSSPSSSAVAGTSSAGDENGYISLDTFADFNTGSPALWAFPMPEDWEITLFDEDGQNQISNAELSCLYTTLQSRQPASDTSATGDLADSAETLASIEASYEAQALATTITVLDNVDLSWGAVGSGTKMEFLSSRINYERADTGEAYSTIVVVRATPHIGGLLYATVNCPSATFGSATDPTQDLLDGSGIIPAP